MLFQKYSNRPDFCGACRGERRGYAWRALRATSGRGAPSWALPTPNMAAGERRSRRRAHTQHGGGRGAVSWALPTLNMAAAGQGQPSATLGLPTGLGAGSFA
ncbi:hypothetical protein J1605_001364 [Eschrichtius robustus]|uniref:Uncharacterized protein n=1 Tax=Eschrichtius robustus TaxID=9764 RepID=A0AB34I3U3_ESCRO|nr:hypothetical protein J1605_001364 [Eschrichtius robustus]